MSPFSTVEEMEPQIAYLHEQPTPIIHKNVCDTDKSFYKNSI